MCSLSPSLIDLGVMRWMFGRPSNNSQALACVCIVLPWGVDLTSPAGKMTMQVIAAVAEFERDLLIERTQSGIVRAKAAGKQFGRPPALNAQERATVVARLGDGASIAELAREFKTTRQTIMRVREAALKLPLQQIA